jgi:hypothetical protein
MIATITTTRPQHFQFRAMMSGLVVDEITPGTFDVTYRDGEKVLGLIRETGGRIIAKTYTKHMTPTEGSGN